MKIISITFVVSISVSTMLAAMDNGVAIRKNQHRKRDRSAEEILEVKRAKKEQKTCPVCCDDLKKKISMTLSCHTTHQFHAVCIQKWREKNSELCPFGCAYNLTEWQKNLMQQLTAKIHVFKAENPNTFWNALEAGALSFEAMIQKLEESFEEQSPCTIL